MAFNSFRAAPLREVHGYTEHNAAGVRSGRWLGITHILFLSVLMDDTDDANLRRGFSRMPRLFLLMMVTAAEEEAVDGA